MTDGYVELHGRSAFSFLEGASMPEAMAQQAANLGMPALGILDCDGLYGAPRLYMTAKKLGLRSHIGAEISTGEFGSQVLPETWQPHNIPERPVRLSLLCESQTGYKNLSQLITGYKLQQKTKGERCGYTSEAISGFQTATVFRFVHKRHSRLVQRLIDWQRLSPLCGRHG